ncbi:hypothetical protein TSAR_006983 [Trichomalopsis sarcophagae]|uniref:Uncharacterized protein n=1 Tax=Trichomalopsis sarcophagae TaxID=543379 RepID=A0A232EXZ0_9HYME|nr:hypothetical protein TSAR_006983 [Trichomalopsis sarcophagae]
MSIDLSERLHMLSNPRRRRKGNNNFNKFSFGIGITHLKQFDTGIQNKATFFGTKIFGGNNLMIQGRQSRRKYRKFNY